MTTATIEAFEADEQRKKALKAANEVRGQKAIRRRELRTLPRPESVALAQEMLRSPDRFIEAMEVRYFLASVKRMGPAAMRDTLRRAGLADYERKNVRDLTARQRDALTRALGRHG